MTPEQKLEKVRQALDDLRTAYLIHQETTDELVLMALDKCFEVLDND